MTLSSRHHYLPEFLIKGFTGNDNKLAVYNIEKQRVDTIRKSPKQLFFEWNRNTFKLHGEETDFVEGLFQFSESQFAPIYNRIIQQQGPVNVELPDLFHLVFFIGVLHWRNPSMDSAMNEFMANASNKDLFFTIKDLADNQEVSEKFYNRVMQEPAFIESSKIIKAIIDYLKTDISSDLKNWRLYYSSGEVQIHLLGDNPLIMRDENTTNIFETELIFPLSKGKMIYHSKGKIIKELPPEYRVYVDMIVFLQSKRMICGPDESYLKCIAAQSRYYKSENSLNILKEKVFNNID